MRRADCDEGPGALCHEADDPLGPVGVPEREQHGAQFRIGQHSAVGFALDQLHVAGPPRFRQAAAFRVEAGAVGDHRFQQVALFLLGQGVEQGELAARAFQFDDFQLPVARIVEVTSALLDGRALPEVHLGLRVRPLTPKIRAAIGFDGAGVLVDHVAGGGAADRAGLKPGDVLVKVAGEKIAVPGDIAFALDGVRSGRVVLSVIRKGSLSEMIAETSTDLTLAPAGTSGTPEIRSSYSLEDFGLSFDTASRIDTVRDKSFAQYLGLSVGDRVLALDGTAVTGDMLGAYRITRPALLLVELSDRSTRHYVLDPWAAPGRLLPVSGANVLDAETVIF